MARSLNLVTIMGNVTRDPEVRAVQSGQNVANFSLALNRTYKDKNGDLQEATDYIDAVAWGQLADQIATRVRRGSRVLVQGRLQSRAWEQDGQKRSKVEVLANDVTFLDGKDSAEPERSDSSYNDNYDQPITLDDIPNFG